MKVHASSGGAWRPQVCPRLSENAQQISAENSLGPHSSQRTVESGVITTGVPQCCVACTTGRWQGAAAACPQRPEVLPLLLSQPAMAAPCSCHGTMTRELQPGGARKPSRPFPRLPQHVQQPRLVRPLVRPYVVLPCDQRRRGHHDALHAAAVQPELDAAIVEQVELQVAPAPATVGSADGSWFVAAQRRQAEMRPDEYDDACPAKTSSASLANCQLL